MIRFTAKKFIPKSNAKTLGSITIYDKEISKERKKNIILQLRIKYPGMDFYKLTD